MKGLFYKDYRMILMSFQRLPIIILLFLVISLFNEAASFWSVYAMFMGCSIISTLQNTDEASKWCMYCDTLPLKRSDLVKEKYLFALIVVGIIIAVYIVMRLVAGLFGIGAGTSYLVTACLAMGLMGIVSSSLTLLSSFVFGPQKGQTARTVMILVMVGICMAIITFAPSVLEVFEAMNPLLLLAVCCILPLLFAGLCYKISCTAFEKRVLQ